MCGQHSRNNSPWQQTSPPKSHAMYSDFHDNIIKKFHSCPLCYSNQTLAGCYLMKQIETEQLRRLIKLKPAKCLLAWRWPKFPFTSLTLVRCSLCRCQHLSLLSEWTSLWKAKRKSSSLSVHGSLQFCHELLTCRAFRLPLRVLLSVKVLIGWILKERSLRHHIFLKNHIRIT